jgi:flagellar biosynthesis/type III secretory pathway protein FliH
VQIDVSDDLRLGGVKIETDLSRVNASVEEQIKSIEAALMGGP